MYTQTQLEMAIRIARYATEGLPASAVDDGFERLLRSARRFYTSRGSERSEARAVFFRMAEVLGFVPEAQTDSLSVSYRRDGAGAFSSFGGYVSFSAANVGATETEESV